MNTQHDITPIPPAPPVEDYPDPDGWTKATEVESWRDALRDACAAVFGERIRQARGRISRASLAEQLGVHENTIGKFERGDGVPDAFQVRLIAHVLDCSILWLLGIDKPGTGDRTNRLQTEAIEHEDQVLVPYFDVFASAGHGAFDQIETVRGMRAFATDYVRNELGIPHNRVALVNVIGSSMEPSIHSGDVVLIDRADVSGAIDGAYLVRIDGALLVKLLQRLPGGRIRVASKNEAYTPFEVDINKDGQDFEVLGRVRWAGVTFR